MMRFGLNLRLWLILLLLVAVPLIALQQLLTWHFSKSMHASTTAHLIQLANSKMAQIDHLIVEDTESARALAQLPITKDLLKEIGPLYKKGIASPDYRRTRQIYLDMVDHIEHFDTFYDLFLISLTGEVMLTYMEESDLGTNLFSGPYRDTALADVAHQALNTLSSGFSSYEWYTPSKSMAAFIAVPVMEGQTILGMLAVQISQGSIDALSSDYSGLGKTGEIIIVQKKGNEAAVIAPLRNNPRQLTQLNLQGKPDSAITHALKGERGTGIYADYRGHEVLAAWGYLPRPNWAIVVKIDTDEVFLPIKQMQQWSTAILLLLLALAAVIAMWLGRSIVRPIKALTQAAGEITTGTLDKRIPVQSNDELGDLAKSFNLMTNNLEITQRTLLAERQGLEETVLERTAALEAINTHLMREITEHQAAKAELQLAQTVYESTSQGIVVTDNHNKIISVNPAFTRITGYSSEEVIGLKSGFNKAGYHDTGFYQDMWQSISQQGHWSGEIWDRRKDGEAFPQWLTISAVHDAKGSIYRYIGVFTDITEQKQAQEKIHYQANFDGLTHLPNRHLFLDRLEQEIRKAHRDASQVALLFIDLDNFKEINDTLGHEQGDQLLREAAKRILACVRETDTVARLGGDEFMVILPDVQSNREIEVVAQKIIQSLILPFVLSNENKGYISASVGITICPIDGDNPEVLLKNADQAMYEAKHLGKNRYSYFTNAMQQASQQRLLLSNELRTAVQQGQFEMYFQPIHDLSTGQVLKAEALIRWHHPERGFVSPASFIPVAEEVGLIGEIGEFAFSSSVQQLKIWLDKFPLPLGVSINLSPRQIAGQINFEAWIELMRTSGIPIELVTLEITEGSLLDGNLDVQKKLRRLREAGFKISIDDFGTGYSSLSYLKKFDVDYLKVDQSFVRDLAVDQNDRALVEAIIVMAHKLGIKVIAEGCETAEQRDVLTMARCNFVQGYFYAKPMSSQDFISYMGLQHASH